MEHYNYSDATLVIKVNFDSNDFAHFHDAIIDATDKNLNQQELLEVWDLLPLGIRCTAIEWGMSDYM